MSLYVFSYKLLYKSICANRHTDEKAIFDIIWTSGSGQLISMSLSEGIKKRRKQTLFFSPVFFSLVGSEEPDVNMKEVEHKQWSRE